MIFIPNECALVVKASTLGCTGCFFTNKKADGQCFGKMFSCNKAERPDGNDVIFELMYLGGKETP